MSISCLLYQCHNLRDIVHVVDKAPTPSLLPIFRSQQQAELLALVLGDPAAEHRLTELAERTHIPYPSVHREVERAKAAGLMTSRLVGRTWLIRADVSSPYFEGLSDVLVKAFGVPWVLGQALTGVRGIDAVYVYGSWAARFSGENGDRPVGDIDLLVLGGPDRDEVYAAASESEGRLGRTVQVTIRSASWLTEGSGTFHDTVVGRPMVPVPLTAAGGERNDRSPAAGRPTRRRPKDPPVPTSNRPARQDDRSVSKTIEIHRIVLGKFLDDPGRVLDLGRARLVTLERSSSKRSAPYIESWRRLLDGPRSDVVRLLMSTDEDDVELLKMSPFTTMLSEDERAQVTHRSKVRRAVAP